MNKAFHGRTRPPVKRVSGQPVIATPTDNHWKLKAVLCATLLILLAPITTFGQTGNPEDHYLVLEWKDLVREGWEPPLLLSEEEVMSPGIDESSLVPELDHKLVALPGFMRPVVREGDMLAHDHDHEQLSGGTKVSEFLLVPFLPQHPCQHALWDPNQVVYVNLVEPVVVDKPDSPIWVVGTITLDNIMTDDGPSAYRIIDAVTTNYEY